MGVDEIVKKIEGKEKLMKDKVRSMEKEVMRIYEQYSKIFSGAVIYTPDKSRRYELFRCPSGEIMAYKVYFEEKMPEKDKSAFAVISQGYSKYERCEILDPSYILALKGLKDHMISKLEEKEKKFDDIEKLFG